MLAADEIFADECAEYLRDEIRQAGGNEVFFRAVYEPDGIVRRAEAVARGNADSVAACADLPRPWNLVIHNHPGGDLAPSQADTGIAAILLAKEIGFLIVDSAVARVNAVVEPAALTAERPVDVDALAAVFAADGALPRILPGYEARASQERMARAVAESLNDGRHLVVEAPTGTGKSLAYLVPLAAWALENGARCLVSTCTLNLQEQLIEKDIPVVRRLFPEELRVVIVKGRGHYLCLRRLESVRQGFELPFDEREQAEWDMIGEWAKTTASGTRSDLPESVGEAAWERVASEADGCAGMKCPAGRDCFFRRARREAAQAHLLVANHAIFFADLALRGGQGADAAASVFPACRRVVLDEAHNIEAAATSHFGGELSPFRLRRRLSRLVRATRTRQQTGLLPALVTMLSGHGDEADACAAELQDQILPAARDLAENLERIFAELREVFAWRFPGPPVQVQRILPALRGEDWFGDRVVPLLEELSGRLLRLGSALTRLYSRSTGMDESLRENIDPLLIQLVSFANRVSEDADFIARFCRGDEENTVFWIELRSYRQTPFVSIHQAPVDVSTVLHDHLYAIQRGVIHTSATLCIENSFTYFTARCGLERLPAARLRSERLPEVFDYPGRALLALLEGFPVPEDPRYPDAFAALAAELIQRFGGGLFFLFTAQRTMERCHEATVPLLPPDWRADCLLQGTMERSHMLEEFRLRPHGVLFGVSSFWEGVDVRGDRLTGVVITKLPFQVPSDPVVAARTERIEAAGRSAFREYSLPHAVLRLKQGFGRLIRSRSDYGVVLIMDDRIITKGYGRTFLASLPPAARITADPAGLVAAIDGFLTRFKERAS